jgi:SNF2 family DNA or RNA helicase
MTTVAEKFQKYLQRTKLDSKEYQVKGVEWCVDHEINGFEIAKSKKIYGGIMADEMGLGKTIQMLGTIVCNFKQHTLIVLPKALLDQWNAAIIKTLGHTPLVYHHISKEKRADVNERLKSSPIVLTTYGMITLLKKSKKRTPLEPSPLYNIKWDRVIFDEAHHLRNNKTGEYAGALKLKSRIVWMVTGTPIQNKVSDLYSLFDILKIPLHYYYGNAAILHAFSTQIMIHRTKADVGLVLPALCADTQNVDWATLSEKKNAENYHRGISACVMIDALAADALLAAGAGASDAEDDDASEADAGEDSILLKILRARQTCILAALMNGPRLQQRIDAGTSGMKPIHSSKLKAVIAKIVERKENGKHKIVFCHYRGEIDFIKTMLVEEQQMKVSVIDGRTNNTERRKILQAADVAAEQGEILILQIQTGCEGLNLQKFSEVYFVSPHWNPAVEDQAIARCHRIGQTVETDVFRFYMNGFDEEKKKRSLDEYVSTVQIQKKELVKLLW